MTHFIFSIHPNRVNSLDLDPNRPPGHTASHDHTGPHDPYGIWVSCVDCHPLHVHPTTQQRLTVFDFMRLHRKQPSSLLSSISWLSGSQKGEVSSGACWVGGGAWLTNVVLLRFGSQRCRRLFARLLPPLTLTVSWYVSQVLLESPCRPRSQQTATREGVQTSSFDVSCSHFILLSIPAALCFQCVVQWS